MKNTNKETHNLWFEALRMSDEYRQLCEKFENQAGPFETMSKDDIHPDTVRTFEKFDNIFNYDNFDAWWEIHCKLEEVLDQITNNTEMRQIHLPEFISELWKHVESNFIEIHNQKPNYDEFKKLFLQYLSNSYQVKQLMYFTVDTCFDSTAEDIGNRIAKLITKNRESFSSQSGKRLSKTIELYLKIYREKKIKNRHAHIIAKEKNISVRDVYRYAQKAESIIKNATHFDFPGKY